MPIELLLFAIFILLMALWFGRLWREIDQDKLNWEKKDREFYQGRYEKAKGLLNEVREEYEELSKKCTYREGQIKELRRINDE